MALFPSSAELKAGEEAIEAANAGKSMEAAVGRDGTPFMNPLALCLAVEAVRDHCGMRVWAGAWVVAPCDCAL